MADPGTAVITGAARGLGFASTVRLRRAGRRAVAAMRTPDRGMALLRKVTGVGADDDRLIGVELDLTRTASIASAARSIKAAAGVSDSLVHNAGISAGMVEVGQVFRSPTSVPVLFSMRSGACSQASGVLRAH